jgi:hypothetical protein
VRRRFLILQGRHSIKQRVAVFTAILCLVGAYCVRGDWPCQGNLISSDGAGGDCFGKAVSITADYCIVGAWGDDDKGTSSGSAYIFSRSGKNWNQSDKLIASDGTSFDNFGCSVGISGPFSIVGAENKNAGGTSSGQAYIFENGIEQAKLTPSDGMSLDYFGCAVAIDGNYAIAGALGDDDKGSASGSAYIFFYNAAVWAQQDKLLASDGLSSDNFGSSVAIDGNYAIVGALYNNDKGSAYIFKRDGNNWSQDFKLTADDGFNGDRFGTSVAIDGNYAIVGASYKKVSGYNQAGSAYIFVYDGSNWSQQAKLIASDYQGYDHFGCSVAIDGNYAVVGAYGVGGFDQKGAVYIFKRDTTTWTEQLKLTAFDSADGDQYGIAVGISGYHVLAGAHYKDLPGKNQAGAAYVYRESSSITLQNPNGGEKLLSGTTHEITWQVGAADDVKLEYSTNNGSSWNTIVTVPDTGSYPWVVPQLNSQQCLLRIADVDYPTVSDTSDAAFEIYTGTLKLLDPNGGEELIAGLTCNVQWQIIDGNVVDVLLDYSTNNGSSWTTIDTVPSNTGSYSWLVPQEDSNQCLIKISDADHPTVKDTSNNVFTIETRILDLQSPNGSEELISDTTHEISWQSQGNIENVILEYSINNGSDWTTIDTVQNTGSYPWLVPRQSTNQCLVRITDVAYSFVNDVSDNMFDIDICFLTLQDPNGGEKLVIGNTHHILWDSQGFVENILIEYSLNNGTDWYDVNTVPADTNSYPWLVPDPPSIDCLIRITNPDYPSYSDISDGVFEVNVCPFTADMDENCWVDWYELDILAENWLASDINEWFFSEKLTASDAQAGDCFGACVGVSGDFLIVGAEEDDDNGENSGSVYMFKYTDSNWIELDKLTASDVAEGDYFGSSVAIDGNYCIVGAPWDDDPCDRSGSAYVFHYNGINWIQQAKLNADDPGDRNYFGISVAINGDYTVVGAFGDDDNGNWSGSAYIFERSGGTWTQQAKLLPLEGTAYDFFGISVAINGDYCIVGADQEIGGTGKHGFACIYKREGTTWTQQEKLTASDGQILDLFGCSVSIDGDYCIVGAELDDDNGLNSGSAYIFERNGTNWLQQTKITPLDGTEDDRFGFSVSIDSQRALVGAYGDDDIDDFAGSAYIFKLEDSDWVEQNKLIASDGAAYDYFGEFVSVNDKYAIIGSWGDDDDGSQSGSIYVFGKYCSLVDLNDDCLTDFYDFAILAEQWLREY